MSNIRKGLAVVSVCIPYKLKEYLDKQADREGFQKRSDVLRKLVIDFTKQIIPAEDYAVIMAEIEALVGNRQ